MKTHSPIASISYMSEEYLDNTLQSFVNLGDLQFYCFVKHKPEDLGEKEHIHLYLEPTHIIDTNDFMFHNDICGTIAYRKSDFGNWYFYASHNKEYLDDKGKQRKYSYSFPDFHCNCFYDLRARIDSLEIETFLSDKYLNSRRIRSLIFNAVENNIPFADVVKSDYIPLNMIIFAQKLYDIQYQYKFNKDVKNARIYNDLLHCIKRK